MTALATVRIPLSTGITINACQGGPRTGRRDPIIFLHGFPESHRTWRYQLADLSQDHFVVAPDQRGFGRSDKPQDAADYEAHEIVADLIALADALDIRHFSLVGHDWGGAAAWLAALTHPGRIRRLVIVNAPHPLIFAKSLIEDEQQRAASQYMRAFRSPLIEQGIKAMGLEAFFEKSFGPHVDLAKIPERERRRYLEDWSQPGALTAMFNWYRASKMEVPAPGEQASLPAWTQTPFPRLAMPTLVIWGLKDKALLPIQLEGLGGLVDDLQIVTSATAGHFIPWEEPATVTCAIRDFLDLDLRHP
ncbi:alpha/beta fold hydrolase [Sphingosinicella rhizophila]|uniref:Alpha/beta hydrolase n=1 Tax=Sphingosinicella rhizophila TaxID=3050082 RepID=A0ABU3Q8K9_9SPHN|nr:alpha/beta hydrolase [Sphingosinicella sp. GR2756]MDT9599736.1 alpha/beta hydrolase [Sphingosinicella sp. GR2756]